MTQHVYEPTIVKKKTALWTPWGSQAVPDLDKALKNQVKRQDKRRASPPKRQTKQAEPGLR